MKLHSFQPKIGKGIVAIVLTVSILWASGIVPAIIPQAVPAANKQGNSTKFQLAGTNSGTNGNVLCNDVNGNATDSACSGAAVTVPFSSITNGTNAAAAMVVNTGASLASTNTGLIESNKVRNYTVATLPVTPDTGALAYVTDGASVTDCSTGSGSTKVLCQYSGSAWGAVGGTGSGITFYPTNGTIIGPAWSLTLPPTTGWTWANQGGSTNNTTNGYLYLLHAKIAGAGIRAYCRSVPATPWSARALIMQDQSGGATFSAPGNESFAGIGFSDGTKYFTIGDGQTTGTVSINTTKWTNTGTFSAFSVNNNTPPAAAIAWRETRWYRISDDGTTNIKFYYSIDGNNWITFDTQARLGFLASVSEICLYGYANLNDIQQVILSYSEDATP